MLESAREVVATRQLDGPALRSWVERGYAALLGARELLDALNVFPVPDADTGTNLVLTFAEGRAAATALPPDAALGEVAQAVADGALMGARGNSGILLSQYLRALGETFAEQSDADGAQVAWALDRGALSASAAMAEPVEGTALTVTAAAADAARRTAYLARGAATTRVDDVVLAALGAARESLLRTPSMLAPLAERGVVDAGGAGFVVLLQALADVVTGSTADPLELTAPDTAAWSHATQDCAAPTHGTGDLAHWQAGDYEVMYVLRATHQESELLQAQLARIGSSVGVVGGLSPGRSTGLWHVHVHTDEPVAAVAAARGAPLRQVCVRYLRDEVTPDADALGAVACTRAPGLLAPLAQAGAVAVLVDPAGPRGVRAGIARAVVDSGRPHVVVLPCDEVSTEAAWSIAAELAGGRPRVTPVGSVDEVAVVAGVAALGTPGGAEATEEAVREAVERTRTALVAWPDVPDDLTQAAVGGLRGLLRPGDEVLTVVVGRRVGAGVVAAVTETAEAAVAGIEVIVLDGGQGEPAIALGVE